jgi:hypothetical protein
MGGILPPKFYIFVKGRFLDFFLFNYVVQHCFICRPSDSSVSEDARIKSKTVATLALTARRSNQSARSHPYYICLLSLSAAFFLLYNHAVWNFTRQMQDFRPRGAVTSFSGDFPGCAHSNHGIARFWIINLVLPSMILVAMKRSPRRNLG